MFCAWARGSLVPRERVFILFLSVFLSSASLTNGRAVYIGCQSRESPGSRGGSIWTPRPLSERARPRAQQRTAFHRVRPGRERWVTAHCCARGRARSGGGVMHSLGITSLTCPNGRRATALLPPSALVTPATKSLRQRRPGF